jgi:uncharacterized protein (DUF885 family)
MTIPPVQPTEPSTAQRFAEVAADAITALCAEYPDYATVLGNHDYDGRLSYPTQAAASRRRSQLNQLLSRLDELDRIDAGGELCLAEQVDREILRTDARGELLVLGDLDEPSWDALRHNPGQGLYALIAQDFAPLAERLESVAGRLRSVPDYFVAARERLTDPPAVHLETAIGQLAGTKALITDEIPRLLSQAGLDPTLADTIEQAAQATERYQDWLRERLPTATRSPRLGAELFGRKLALTLATPWQPDALLQQAFEDLARIEAELAELVGSRHPNARVGRAQIAAEFDALAADAPTSANILDNCRAALAETTRFVAEQELLTLLHDPVEVQEMPEIDRGVAVAYCQAVGALETAPIHTRFAVSPTPADWSPERVNSFYREYNNHMLHNLTVHEAMPGHVEQLSHSRRYAGTTKVRDVFGSGSFIEGWAVYAEELMATRGYRSDVSAEAAAAVRMQQLKMQLRTVINTILDISFHAGDLDEAGAMDLMTGRGYQEEGEAAGKWRRVQLTSTQLCTYYVGYLEVRRLADDLRVAHPEWSELQLHDTMLSFGSPPVRHLRTLLGLPGQ